MIFLLRCTRWLAKGSFVFGLFNIFVVEANLLLGHSLSNLMIFALVVGVLDVLFMPLLERGTRRIETLWLYEGLHDISWRELFR